MKLTSIRENYGKLLTAFKDAGIKLSESQQADLDTFMVAFESKLEQTKANAIKATKKVVEERMSKEYQKVFESIIKHQNENHELAGKIQTKIASINESKKLAKKVDQYLDLYLEEVLPDTKIIDYDRMSKLEKMFESMKDVLLVNDQTIEDKQKALEEKYSSVNEGLNKEISSLKDKLNESMKHELALKNEIDVAKAEKLIKRKVKDLPLFEARQVSKRLAGSTCAEVNANFKKILESVREEMKETCEAEEKGLEEEIRNIIESDNADTPEKKDSDKTEPTVATEATPPVENTDGKEEIEEDNDVVLNESEKIPAYFMKAWISRASSITPIDDLAGAKTSQYL